MKITKQRLKEIIKEELAESNLGPWRTAFEKISNLKRLNAVERELVELAAGLKRLGIGDKDVKDMLDPLTTAVEANVEGELGLEEHTDAMHGAERLGPEIEDIRQPEEDDPSDPSEEAMTVTRPFLAMTGEFAQYLRDNEVPSEYDAIKQHFIDLGLAPAHAGIYALYAAESFGLGEVVQSGGTEPKPPKEHSEVSYKPTPPTRKAYHKAVRAKAKRDLKK